jgi:hypothetical protein
MVLLLRAEGGEKESHFGLVALEDGRPTEAETMILPLTPDESLVVDVARGLDSGSMIEQAHRILMQALYGVGKDKEECNVEGFVWACVLAILCVSFRLEVFRGTAGESMTRGVRRGLAVPFMGVRPRDIKDELSVGDGTCKVAVVRELEVDVTLANAVSTLEEGRGMGEEKRPRILGRRGLSAAGACPGRSGAPRAPAASSMRSTS